MSILFPIAKQVFAKTISQDLVRVQPMNYNEEFERQRLLEERRIKIKNILEKSKK
jgi:hypothetical protein|tara:strand:+ start:1074 stop:1238 length:165 start_codon:yes stop_codon:yes gene_type:complete